MATKKTKQPGDSSPAEPAAKKANRKGLHERSSHGQSAVQLCLHALLHCGEQLALIQDADTLGQILAHAQQLQKAAQQRLQALKSKSLQPKKPLQQPSVQPATQQQNEKQQDRQPSGKQRWTQQQRLERQQQQQREQQQQQRQQQPLPEAKPLQIVEDRQPYRFVQAGCTAAAGTTAAGAAAASRPQYMPPLQQQYKGSASEVALAERCAHARAAYTAGAAGRAFTAAAGAAAAGPPLRVLSHRSGAAGAAVASSPLDDVNRGPDDTSSGSDNSSSSDSDSSSSGSSSGDESSSSGSDTSTDSDSSGSEAAPPSPAIAGKGSQQQLQQGVQQGVQQQQQQQQQQQCLICMRLCRRESLMANKLMAACSVCTAGALQGGTSSLARCPKRHCGKQDVRLGPKGWHAGVTGPQHYISVSSAGFRVHYTSKKKPKKKMQAPKQGMPVQAAASPGGVRKKQRQQHKVKKAQKQQASSL